VYIGLPWLTIKACASNLSGLKKFAMTWSSLPAPFMLDRECFRECISELFPEHEAKVVTMPYDPKHHHAYRSFLNALVLHLFGLLAKTNPALDWADRNTQNSLLHHNVLDNFLYYPMGYLVSAEFEDYVLQDTEHQSLVQKAIGKFVNNPKGCTLYLSYDAKLIKSYSSSFYHAVQKLISNNEQRKRVAPVKIDLLFHNTTTSKAAKSVKTTPTKMPTAGPPNGQGASLQVVPPPHKSPSVE
jgi:hypothetical protein